MSFHCILRFKTIIPITEQSLIQMLCHLLECLLSPENTPTNCSQELHELYFVFAAIWAFGGALSREQVLCGLLSKIDIKWIAAVTSKQIPRRTMASYCYVRERPSCLIMLTPGITSVSLCVLCLSTAGRLQSWVQQVVGCWVQNHQVSIQWHRVWLLREPRDQNVWTLVQYSSPVWDGPRSTTSGKSAMWMFELDTFRTTTKHLSLIYAQPQCAGHYAKCTD